MAKLWLYRIAGFVVGAGLTFVLEVGFLLFLGELFGKRLMPRGLGWVILPILAGIALARVAPDLGPVGRFASTALVRNFWSASPLGRLVVVAPVFWILAVGAYVILFEPYGDMYSSDYIHMMKVMLFPSILFIVGYLSYKKLILGKKNTTDGI